MAVTGVERSVRGDRVAFGFAGAGAGGRLRGFVGYDGERVSYFAVLWEVGGADPVLAAGELGGPWPQSVRTLDELVAVCAPLLDLETVPGLLAGLVAAV
jgi:hypothetical protein